MRTKKVRYLLFMLMLLALSTAKAAILTVVVDGIRYRVDTESQTAAIVAAKGNRYHGNIIVPANITVKGTSYPVTSIADECFKDCTDLTSITIGEYVTSLGDRCFAGCTGLKNVIIPNSVTEMGNSCFDGCTSLTSLTFPRNLIATVYSKSGQCDLFLSGSNSMRITSENGPIVIWKGTGKCCKCK